MRVPLSWLADYVDIDLTPEQLADRLTRLGMEVQGIERWGADWQDVVVGELLTVEPHPRADRLSLTTVRVGDGEPLSIVCGATGDELRLTTDAEGILILEPDAPIGRALGDLFGDTVLDVDVKPNRGDALCLVGLAREVSAVTGAPVRWPETAVSEGGRPVSSMST
ncbi:MAG: hypothetical protein E6I94_06765 [Chloroflexi bacterium]|nr:MAG: hypothetical protein E6I94_06765 [Chloroflexota bacterium]